MHKKEINTTTMLPISQFQLPRYNEIPNVGLYLKQVVVFINDALEPYFRISVKETMLSNYVKLHIISSPVKKMYSRDQIAALMFISLAKTVLSLENIQRMLKIQDSGYSMEKAYDYFCCEFENVLQYVYGCTDRIEQIGSVESQEKGLLRNIIITMAHQFYLEECFQQMNQNNPEQE